MQGKRSRAATKGRVKKVITGKQRSARKINIKQAQKARKGSKPGSQRRKAGLAFKGAYKAARKQGMSKGAARYEGHMAAFGKSTTASHKMISAFGRSKKAMNLMNTKGKKGAGGWYKSLVHSDVRHRESISGLTSRTNTRNRYRPQAGRSSRNLISGKKIRNADKNWWQRIGGGK